MHVIYVLESRSEQAANSEQSSCSRPFSQPFVRSRTSRAAKSSSSASSCLWVIGETWFKLFTGDLHNLCGYIYIHTYVFVYMYIHTCISIQVEGDA